MTHDLVTLVVLIWDMKLTGLFPSFAGCRVITVMFRHIITFLSMCLSIITC